MGSREYGVEWRVGSGQAPIPFPQPLHDGCSVSCREYQTVRVTAAVMPRCKHSDSRKVRPRQTRHHLRLCRTDARARAPLRSVARVGARRRCKFTAATHGPARLMLVILSSVAESKRIARQVPSQSNSKRRVRQRCIRTLVIEGLLTAAHPPGQQARGPDAGVAHLRKGAHLDSSAAFAAEVRSSEPNAAASGSSPNPKESSFPNSSSSMMIC